MITSEQKCGNCLFWRKKNNDPEGMPVCTRFPPTANTTCGLGVGLLLHTNWPETFHYQWCGEWKAKNHGEVER